MSISQSVTIISARDASASENCPWFYKNEPIWRISRTALLLLLTFSCFFWHCIAHIAHLHQFWILRTRPKSCFGGVNERWAATLFFFAPTCTWGQVITDQRLLWLCNPSTLFFQYLIKYSANVLGDHICCSSDSQVLQKESKTQMGTSLEVNTPQMSES